MLERLMKKHSIRLRFFERGFNQSFLVGIIILLSASFSMAQDDYNRHSGGVNITNIYPTSNEIPENCLRFYIYFDSPMREGNALNFIKLFDQQDNEISHVFFDNVHELWTPDHKRLTLLLDPGRVKSGLQANAAMGRAFTEKNTYRLVVTKGFEGLNGYKMTSDYVKTFTAIREDRKGLDINQWHFEYPKNKTDSLKIDFKESVDHVSANHYILIVDSHGTVIPTIVDLQKNEKKVIFKPVSNWVKGTYRILINHRFEDIAANNINGAFDHKVGSLKSLTEGDVSSIEFVIPAD